jgi:hypothetical protein
MSGNKLRNAIAVAAVVVGGFSVTGVASATTRLDASFTAEAVYEVAPQSGVVDRFVSGTDDEACLNAADSANTMLETAEYFRNVGFADYAERWVGEANEIAAEANADEEEDCTVYDEEAA